MILTLHKNLTKFCRKCMEDRAKFYTLCRKFGISMYLGISRKSHFLPSVRTENLTVNYWYLYCQVVKRIHNFLLFIRCCLSLLSIQMWRVVSKKKGHTYRQNKTETETSKKVIGKNYMWRWVYWHLSRIDGYLPFYKAGFVFKVVNRH